MSKKNLRLVPDETTALIRIEWEGGGEVPLELSGSYTDTPNAQRAIAAYMAAKGRVVEVKDKTKQTTEEAKQSTVEKIKSEMSSL